MVVVLDISKRPQIDAAVTDVVNELAPAVRKIRFEIGEDWSGEQAIFFREPENLRAIARRVVSTMSQRLDLPVLGLFPYFNFRSEAEQALAKEPAWA
jgi:hypothetical protein